MTYIIYAIKLPPNNAAVYLLLSLMCDLDLSAVTVSCTYSEIWLVAVCEVSRVEFKQYVRQRGETTTTRARVNRTTTLHI